MGMVRDIGFTLPALQETILITCSALVTTGSTGGAISLNSTLDGLISTGGPLSFTGTTATSTVGAGVIFGRVIDRLAAPLGAGYYGASPSAYVHATRGSTEADRRLQLGIKLQHGDSSGGGDMADYSTDRQPAVRTYFSSARTTDMLSWELSGRSTGMLDGVSNWGYYDLNAAKRFIRVAVFGGKDRVTTESSGDEQARVGATITFVGADVLSSPTFTAGSPSFGGQGWLYALERNSPESTSTSTA